MLTLRNNKQTLGNRIMAIVMSVAMLLTLSGIDMGLNVRTARAAAVTIRCGSVHRGGANSATAYLYSDTAGDVYYKISTDSDAPAAADIVSGGVKAAKQAVADTVTDIAINSGGMGSGSIYAYIVVKSGEDISNVVSVAMPADIYISEDFETYSEGTTNQTSFLGFDGNRTIKTVGGSKRYSLTGAVSSGKSGISEGNRIHILEGTLRFEQSSPSAKFAICSQGNINNAMAGVEIAQGTWKSLVAGKEQVVLTDAGTAVKDTDYNVRIVYDWCGEYSAYGNYDDNPVYDIYIDGRKVNATPLEAGKRWYTGISMTSSAGQTTDYDNIKYYFPSNDNYKTTLVNYNLTTATYTKAQNIELTTAMTGRDIYYTTDGSYPTLDITSPGTATKKYTAPFNVGTDNTVVRAMIVKDGKAESIAYGETYSFVGSPTIEIGRIIRGNATNARAFIYSDTAGDIWYKIDDSSVSPSADDIVNDGTKATVKAAEGVITEFNMNNALGFHSGSVYAHIALQDADGTLSNVITYEMPVNIYVYEDFEIYKAGVVNQASLFGLQADRTTIENVAGSKRYCVTGEGDVGKSELGDSTRIFVLEGTIRFGQDSPSARFGISRSSNLYFKGYVAGVEVVSGTWKSIAQDKEPVTLTKAGTAVKDRDYNVRIVYDRYGTDSMTGDNANPVYDVYIDNVKVNDEPLPASTPWYTGVHMSSSTGQKTYFDNIIYYLPSTDYNKTTLVKYAPLTATYTKAQNIELTTSIAGRDIYYTTDGSYPTTDITSPGTRTKKYTAPFSVGTDNTVVRAMMVNDGKAESVAYNETYSFVDVPSIRVNTVYRSSYNRALAYIYTDTAGDIYYKIDTDSADPVASDIVDNGYKAAVRAAENIVTEFNMNGAAGLTSGSVYAHIVLQDSDGTLSNVRTVAMPYDYYLGEDFDTYIEDEISQTNFLGLNKDQRTIETVAGSKRYCLTGEVGGGRLSVFEGTRIHILEGTLRFDSDSPSARFGISRHNNWDSFTGYAAGVEIDSGTWKGIAEGQEPVVFTKAAEAVKDRDYNVRIVYDWCGEDSVSGDNPKPVYDVYIDGVKMNDEPLDGSTRSRTGIYMSSSTGQKTYFDNIRCYMPSTDNTRERLVKYNPVTATYTKTQTVGLVASIAGRDIYYTTDGSYPSLDISGSSATKKYTEPFTVEADTSKPVVVRAMIVKDGKAESIAYNETYTFVNIPTIISGEIYRSDDKAVTAYLYSDTAGDIWYKIDTDSTSPTASKIEENGIKAEVKAVEDSVVEFNMNNAAGLASGSVYAHFAVKDVDGTFSNVVTAALPSDRYFSDDLETYREGVISQTNRFGLEAEKRTIKTVAGSKRYCLTGDVSGSAGGLAEGTRLHILEGTIRFDSDSPSAKFGMAAYSRYYGIFYFQKYIAGVEIVSGEWKSLVDGQEQVTLAKAGTAVKDRDYKVRIVYDFCGENSVATENQTPVYDIYIDGVKVNDEPLAAGTRNYTGLNMSSSAGQTTYFDDIKYYLPSNDTGNNKSLFISHNPGTATYSKSQTVELTTSMEGRDIYYTTDGSYPTLDISPSSSTKKYNAPFTVEPDTSKPVTVRAMMVKDGKAESIAYSEIYTFVGTPTIKGNNIYRKTATSAEARIYSDTAGDIYYLTSNEQITPTAEDIKAEGIDTGLKAVEGDTSIIPMTTGMNPRTRYAYIVIEDKDRSFSNVVELYMPYERYFYDDFEAYPARAIKNGDTFKVDVNSFSDISFEKLGNSMVLGGKKVNYYQTLCQFTCNKESVKTGKAVVTAKIRSAVDNPTLLFGFGPSYKAQLYVENGVWKACGNNYEGKQSLDITEDMARDRWYNVRLVLDIDYNTYDIYVDDVKVNAQPLSVYANTSNDYNRYGLEIFFTPIEETTAYIDDVCFYIEEREIIKADEPVAVKGLEYNGETRRGVTYDDNSVAYVISGVTEASDVGTYTAVATLNIGYKWADGTATPKNIVWAIAPKDITMTATASDAVYTGEEPTECVIKAEPVLTGVIEKDKEYIKLSEDSLADITGIYTDIYAGTGKSVCTANDYKFSIVSSDTDIASAANYRLIQPVITGNVTSAEQTLTSRKSIPAVKGDIITDKTLNNAVESSLNIVGLIPDITFSVVSGSEFGTYSFGTGLTISESAQGGRIVLKAVAGSVDVNGDGVPEYAPYTEGAEIVVNIKNEPKTTQTLSFGEEIITVVYGDNVTGQTAVNNRADGGAVTYISSDEEIAAVNSSDGSITVLAAGSVTITATAEATERYTSDSAAYVIIVEKAKQEAPQVNSTDETVTGRADGTIAGLTSDMEYKKAGEAAYTQITEGMLEKGVLGGVAPGVYYIRYKAGNNYRVSDITTVIIKAKEPEQTEPPVITSAPTVKPTGAATQAPTEAPASVPTVIPTEAPTPTPTLTPTKAPTLAPTEAPTPAAVPTATPYTEYEYVPVAKKETIIKKTNTDKKDVEGSRLKFLQLKGTSGKKTVKLSWKRIDIASGYIIYGSKCGTKMSKLAELTGNSVTKWQAAKLAKGRYYKYMVVAYSDTEDGRKVITTSKTVHVVTDGGKKGNPTALNIRKKSLTVKAGRTAVINADVKAKKKVVVHVEKLRYESDNSGVAVVSDDGIIMGLKKGKTTIYVYTQNGICGKIKLTVKNP